MTDPTQPTLDGLYQELHSALRAAAAIHRTLGADLRLRGIDQHRHAVASQLLLRDCEQFTAPTEARP